MKELEITLTEIGGIFDDLGILVNEQQDMVDNLEAHVEHAKVDVKKGVVDLEKAAKYQKSAGKTKWVIVCLIICFIIINVQ